MSLSCAKKRIKEKWGGDRKEEREVARTTGGEWGWAEAEMKEDDVAAVIHRQIPQSMLPATTALRSEGRSKL